MCLHSMLWRKSSHLDQITIFTLNLKFPWHSYKYLASVGKRMWSIIKLCQISISTLDASNRKLFNLNTVLIFRSKPCNQNYPLEVYTLPCEATDIMWMLLGFEFKSSTMRIKIFEFVILIRKISVVSSFAVKTMLFLELKNKKETCEEKHTRN